MSEKLELLKNRLEQLSETKSEEITCGTFIHVWADSQGFGRSFEVDIPQLADEILAVMKVYSEFVETLDGLGV